MTGVGEDPTPWVHVSGTRVTEPGAPGTPRGGYTYRPREGYADYPDRYISTRSPAFRAALAAASGPRTPEKKETPRG